MSSGKGFKAATGRQRNEGQLFSNRSAGLWPLCSGEHLNARSRRRKENPGREAKRRDRRLTDTTSRSNKLRESASSFRFALAADSRAVT